jgi:hypothetical protein
MEPVVFVRKFEKLDLEFPPKYATATYLTVAVCDLAWFAGMVTTLGKLGLYGKLFPIQSIGWYPYS